MKITPSRLLNVVLAVLLLTSVFLVNATSNRSNVTNTGPYDPWHDINGDGIINIQDATLIAMEWQTQGNPTRNMTIIYPEFHKRIFTDLTINYGFWYRIDIPNGVNTFIISCNLTSGSIRIRTSYLIGDIQVPDIEVTNNAPLIFSFSTYPTRGEALVIEPSPFYQGQSVTFSLGIYGWRQ